MAERRNKSEEEQEQVAPERAAREAVKGTEPEDDAEQFPIERFVAEGKALLGHSPHVVSGALAGVNRKTLTIEEAKAAVTAWLDSPLKED